MNDLKPPTDDPRAREHSSHVVWRCASYDIEILGNSTEHQIPNAAAYQFGLEPLLYKSMHNLACVAANSVLLNTVFGLTDISRLRVCPDLGWVSGQTKNRASDQTRGGASARRLEVG